MDNAELLTQIAAMLESQMQQINEKFEKQNVEIQKIKIAIENDVAKRIDSLFDGYKLVHEKQWELEHKVEALEARLAKLEAIAG